MYMLMESGSWTASTSASWQFCSYKWLWW